MNDLAHVTAAQRLGITCVQTRGTRGANRGSRLQRQMQLTRTKGRQRDRDGFVGKNLNFAKKCRCLVLTSRYFHPSLRRVMPIRPDDKTKNPRPASPPEPGFRRSLAQEIERDCIPNRVDAAVVLNNSSASKSLTAQPNLPIVSCQDMEHGRRSRHRVDDRIGDVFSIIH